jgi:hypothetical protein
VVLVQRSDELSNDDGCRLPRGNGGLAIADSEGSIRRYGFGLRVHAEIHMLI